MKTTWFDWVFTPWLGGEKANEEIWREPLDWNDAIGRSLFHRPRVLCDVDWLDEVPIEWLADLLALIRRTPNLDWLLLTKRPKSWRSRLEAAYEAGHYCIGTGGDLIMTSWMEGEAPANVWIGAAVENQDAANKRIPQLLSIPAAIRFISCEPMLGPVDLVSVGAMGCDCPDLELDDGTIEERCSGRCSFYRNAIDKMRRIDWIICGGETGKDARPMHPDWVRSLRDQCKAAHVPFFFSQWGEFAPMTATSLDTWVTVRGRAVAGFLGYGEMWRVGKQAAGRLLDGVEHNEFPELRN